MPVLREDQEKRTGRGDRRWRWLLAVPPLLVLLLLLATASRPIFVPIGDRCYFIGGAVMPGISRGYTPLQADSFPVTGAVDTDNGVWMASRGWGCNLRVGDYIYAAGWFRGKRVP